MNERLQQSGKERKSKLRFQTPQSLCESIERGSALLQNVALRGIRFHTGQRKEVIFLFMLAYFNGDFSRSEDLLGIKLGSRNITLCNICEAENHELSFFTICSHKDLLKTYSTFSDFFCLKKQSAAEDTLAEVSMLSLFPVLCALPVIGVNQSLHVYAFIDMSRCLNYLSVKVVCSSIV